MQNYNFVIHEVKSDYAKIAMHDLKEKNNVCLRGDIFESRSKLLQTLYVIHTYPRFNRRFKLPGQGIWNRFCFKNNFEDNNPICFVFGALHWEQTELFSYLRKTYPGCKIVLRISDLFGNIKQWCPRISVDALNQNFDLIMSYDKNDCKQYGWSYFDSGTSYMPVEESKSEDKPDVFFAGIARNRLPLLLEVYEKLTQAGVKCDYYIVNAKPEEQKYGDKITYTNQYMPYREMLERTVNAKCVLEVTQENEYGFTTRAVEAIMYNKKLLTNSRIVRDIPFVNSGFIQCFDSVDDIDVDFVKRDLNIDYHYNGEYSPLRLLERIESGLSEKYGNTQGGENNETNSAF